MARQYITYIQCENLIRQWPLISAIKESLQIELDNLKIKKNMIDKDEYIETMSMGNKIIDGTPPAKKIADKTSSTAANYRKIAYRDYKIALKKAKEEKLYIELVDDKLDIAYKRLYPMQRRIIKLFYLDCKIWSEVLGELKEEGHYLSKHQAQTERSKAVRRMQSAARIETRVYEYVMGLIEVE